MLCCGGSYLFGAPHVFLGVCITERRGVVVVDHIPGLAVQLSLGAADSTGLFPDQLRKMLNDLSKTEKSFKSSDS